MRQVSKAVVMACAVLTGGMAHAGPPVEVTFRNLGSTAVDLNNVTSNESSTYLIANPKHDQRVDPGATTYARVQRTTSPDLNAAHMRYTSGGKTCAFGTIYQMRTLPGGIKQPEWTKTATPSGGAICTATITRMGADYSWSVEFTMK